MENINKSNFIRKYTFKSYPGPGTFTILAHPKACFFCDHCTDIFYDSRGPYGIACDVIDADEFDFETGLLGKCEKFKEDN